MLHVFHFVVTRSNISRITCRQGQLELGHSSKGVLGKMFSKLSTLFFNDFCF